MSIIDLIIPFVEVARNLQKEYVEAWLKGQVKDSDMERALVNELEARTSIYPKMMSGKQSKPGVKS